MNVKIIIFFLIIVSFKSVFAFEIKKISIFGKNCKAGGVESVIQNDELKIPLNLEFKKDSGPLVREVCQFSASIHVKKNEAILVSEVQQSVTGLIPSVEVNADLEIRMAGQDRLQISEKLKLNEKDVFLLKDVKRTLKSVCGKDTILNGKLSLFSAESGKAAVKSSDLIFKMISTPCR